MSFQNATAHKDFLNSWTWEGHVTPFRHMEEEEGGEEDKGQKEIVMSAEHDKWILS